MVGPDSRGAEISAVLVDDHVDDFACDFEELALRGQTLANNHGAGSRHLENSCNRVQRSKILVERTSASLPGKSTIPVLKIYAFAFRRMVTASACGTSYVEICFVVPRDHILTGDRDAGHRTHSVGVSRVLAC